MQFGYFDDNKKEYVITNPETPAPWSNYLGSTVYGAIITNNAGGYSFYKSAANGRFMRYRTNSIPMDQPGRYIYMRDQESGDYWSNAWQPVGKPLDKYKSVCRHGTAYTTIESEYSEIISETNYFVPLGKNYEYWHCKLKNNGNKSRKLRLFTYVEYTGYWNLWMDIINLQYTQYLITMKCDNGIIDHGTNVYLPDVEDGGQARHSFIGVAGADVTGFDTDRKAFLGTYGSYSNPSSVIKGECSGSLASGDNGVGVVQFDIELEPAQEKEFVVVMGIGRASKEGKTAIENAKNITLVNKEFNEVKKYWHDRLDSLRIETPDASFNSMMNTWNPYNCLITYAWSRAASLVYAGERDGLGYRDTVQDILGVLPTIANEARERLELMITGQVSTGGAMPVVKTFDHKPGEMPLPEETEYRSDDCLWLFNTIPAYVKETGDIEFYNKILPYSDNGNDSVLGHMKKAIEFSLEHSGAHGLPCGLAADWNDCLMLGQQGESVFVAFQLRYALDTYIDICKYLNKQDEIKWAEKHLSVLDENLEKHAWDGEWYLRAYRHDGLKYGSKSDEEGSIWLNPQTWSVFSKHATGDKAKQIMKNVHERLFTEFGLMICDPPYEKADLNVIKATLFNKGMKENGSIFCHTQGWAVIAEAMNGNGNNAFQYFQAYSPANMNSYAETREIEPYVYSQSTHSKYSARFGASRLPWLTGAATWAYHAASNYILGIQPEYDGITIDPCIPASWDKILIKRKFRNKILNIRIINQSAKQKGVAKLKLNGEEMKNNFIPFGKLNNENEIEVTM